MLLDAGADVAALGNGEDQPIHTARSAEVAAVLIDHGADPGVRGNYGNTPLHRAVEIGDLAFVELLIKHNVDIEPKDAHGLTPLYDAVYRSNLPILKRLVDMGADVNVRGVNNEPLAWKVVRNGRVDVLKFLQQQGVAIDQEPDRFGWTWLHRAALRHRTSMITYLIDSGLDVNARTLSGQTPLHQAAEYSQGTVPEAYKASIHALIRAGADINAIDDEGRTPLAIAMIELKYLSMQGTSRDEERWRQHVEQKNLERQEMVQMLREMGGKL